MNADENQAALTERIIGALFEVSNTLGSGFLEKVYERALLRELKIRGLAAVSRVFWRYRCRGCRCYRIKMRRSARERTRCPEPELPTRLGQDALSTGQLPEAHRGIQARRLVSRDQPLSPRGGAEPTKTCGLTD